MRASLPRQCRAHLASRSSWRNFGGAGGTIGTAKLVAAAPDGYTIMGASVGLPVAFGALSEAQL